MHNLQVLTAFADSTLNALCIAVSNHHHSIVRTGLLDWPAHKRNLPVMRTDLIFFCPNWSCSGSTGTKDPLSQFSVLRTDTFCLWMGWSARPMVNFSRKAPAWPDITCNSQPLPTINTVLLRLCQAICYELACQFAWKLSSRFPFIGSHRMREWKWSSNFINKFF